MKQFDISLCMVVKNEQELLKNCLQSVKRFVKEMIIVDTGSIDRTKEIANEMGAIVIDHKWNGNFSEARNVGIVQATGRWILVLDADEEWGEPEEEELECLLQEEEMYAYYVKVLNYYGNTPEEEDYVTDSVCRLFRNLPHIRFQGLIHEEVTKSIKEHYSIKNIGFSNLKIYHYGYLNEMIKNKKKNERNIQLVRNAIQHHPDDLYMQYALGTEYFQQENFRKALEIYEPIINKLNVTEGYASDLLYKIVYCLKEEKEFEKALSFIQQGKTFYPDFVDLFEMEGLLLFQLDRYTDGMKTLQNCLEIGDVSHKYSTSSGAGTYRTHYLLGLVKERQGEWKQAFEHYSEAIRLEPMFATAVSRWANLSFFYFRDDSEWVSQFQLQFGQISIKSILSILMQAVRWGRSNIGLALLEKVNSSQTKIQLLYAIFLALRGEYEKAELRLLNALSEQEPSEQIYLYLWAFYYSMNKENEANDYIRLLSEKNDSYLEFYNFIVLKNKDSQVSYTIRHQSIQALLSFQGWNNILVTLLNQHYDQLPWLPSELFPMFQHAPKRILKQMIDTDRKGIEQLHYTDIIFLGWSSLKIKDYHTAYHLFQRARKLAPKRIEHVVGFRFWLQSQSFYNKSSVQSPDCLLLTF